jgi:hypothetical protein
LSAEVRSLDGREITVEALAALSREIDAGTVRGVCLVAMHADGRFTPIWYASASLGRHAGSILRGAVCWLGAEMDAKARGE